MQFCCVRDNTCQIPSAKSIFNGHASFTVSQEPFLIESWNSPPQWLRMLLKWHEMEQREVQWMLCLEVLFRTWQAIQRAPKMVAHGGFHWSQHMDSVSALSNSYLPPALEGKQKGNPVVKCTHDSKSPWQPVHKELRERWAIAVRLSELQWEGDKGKGGGGHGTCQLCLQKAFQPPPHPRFPLPTTALLIIVPGLL